MAGVFICHSQSVKKSNYFQIMIEFRPFVGNEKFKNKNKEIKIKLLTFFRNILWNTRTVIYETKSTVIERWPN